MCHTWSQRTLSSPYHPYRTTAVPLSSVPSPAEWSRASERWHQSRQETPSTEPPPVNSVWSTWAGRKNGCINTTTHTQFDDNKKTRSEIHTSTRISSYKYYILLLSAWHHQNVVMPDVLYISTHTDLCRLKELPDLLLGLSRDARDHLSSSQLEERETHLPCNSVGHQCLPTARGAVQEKATRRGDTQLTVHLGMTEVKQQLANFLSGRGDLKMRGVLQQRHI